MTTPIKFELAKLLKEKGFDEECNYFYNEKVLTLTIKYTRTNNSFIEASMENCCLAPTIVEVIMWFYEKHSIWIANNWQSGSKTFLYELIDLNSYENTILIQEKNYKDVGEVEFKTPSEAYEAAIEYTLKNLI